MNDLSFDPNNLYIICHVDHDGMAGACVFKRKYPNANIIVTNYYKPFPTNTIPNGSTVVVVDFSYKKEVMDFIASNYYLVWLDHHATAIDEMDSSGIEYEGLPAKYSPEEFSGCEMAWLYCYGEEPMPDVIKFIGDYDRWEFAYEESLAYHYGLGVLNLYPNNRNLETWEKLLNNDNAMNTSILEKGRRILKFVQTRDTAVAKDIVYETTLPGNIKALVANVRGVNSLFFENYPERETFDVCIAYGWVPKLSKYRFSIYQINPNVDVGEIAASFGGGGHSGAAGWNASNIPWEVPHCEQPHNGPMNDHLWDALAMTNNNAVRLFMAQSDRIGVNSLITEGNLGKFSAKFVNCPYTWGNIWWTSDTAGAQLGVAFVFTNMGNYRMVITNLADADMNEVADMVGGQVHDGESVWAYVPLDNPWLEIPNNFRISNSNGSTNEHDAITTFLDDMKDQTTPLGDVLN